MQSAEYTISYSADCVVLLLLRQNINRILSNQNTIRALFEVHPLNEYIGEYNWAESPTSSSPGFTLGVWSRMVAACKVAPTIVWDDTPADVGVAFQAAWLMNLGNPGS